MRLIFASIVLTLSVALLGTSSAGQDKKDQEKKPEQKEKVLDVGKGLDINSTLDKSKDGAYGDKMYHKVFLVNFVKGKTYQIDMIRVETSKMNPFLYLEDAKKKVLAEDDDSGEEDTFNARITFKAPDDGVYRIIATSSMGRGFGDFNLKVAEKK